MNTHTHTRTCAHTHTHAHIHDGSMHIHLYVYTHLVFMHTYTEKGKKKKTLAALTNMTYLCVPGHKIKSPPATKMLALYLVIIIGLYRMHVNEDLQFVPTSIAGQLCVHRGAEVRRSNM